MQVVYDANKQVVFNPFSTSLLWFKINEQRKAKDDDEGERSSSPVVVFQEKSLMLGTALEGSVSVLRLLRTGAIGRWLK